MTKSAGTPETSIPCGKKRRGMMLVLSAPPGGGKTTISRAVLERDHHTVLSVSATTRDQRPGEVDGVHYHFIDKPAFQDMVDNGEMLEYALVYNKSLYGTPKAPVEEALRRGKDVMFDIDWQGMQQLAAIAPDDVVSVFLLPPDLKTLSDRLHDRARDSEAEIARRMAMARDEISHYREFQYVIVNTSLEDTIGKVMSILVAERRKRHRLVELDAFVERLMAG